MSGMFSLKMLFPDNYGKCDKICCRCSYDLGRTVHEISLSRACLNMQNVHILSAFVIHRVNYINIGINYMGLIRISDQVRLE